MELRRMVGSRRDNRPFDELLSKSMPTVQVNCGSATWANCPRTDKYWVSA